MFICICNAVTESAIRECAGRGACSVEDLAAALGVGAGCGRCRDCAVDVLRGVQGASAQTVAMTE